MEFMEKTLKDIYSETKIGKKYLKKRADNNKKLIEEIYSNNEYIELQKLLNLTFIEFYDIYTHKVTKKDLDENLLQKMNNISFFNSTNFQGIEAYIDKLAEKESDEYIKEFKYYCGIYKETV